ASFRFPVTRDTLAVRLMVPTTKSIADFHRRVTAHVGRTRKSRHICDGLRRLTCVLYSIFS
ncbi:MAG: hypothetical protein AAGU27_26545, partial [Dehalobacterium sp.]